MSSSSSPSPSATPSASPTPFPPLAALTSQSLFELIFPSDVRVDCAAQRLDTGSARTTYACTSSNIAVRLPLTTLHLLVIFVVVLLGALLYVIVLRVSRARADRALRLPPAARPLPVGRDALSRRGQLDVFTGFAAASHDFSPADFLLARRAERAAERAAARRRRGETGSAGGDGGAVSAAGGHVGGSGGGSGGGGGGRRSVGSGGVGGVGSSSRAKR